MKLFLLIITVCFAMLCTSCKDRGSKQTAADTAKLFNPHPDRDTSYLEPFKILENAVSPQKGFYYTSLHNITGISEKDAFEEYVKNHAEEMKKVKMMIICTSDDDLSGVFDAIRIFKNNGIENYRVVKKEEYFSRMNLSPPEAIVVNEPKSVTGIEDRNDPRLFTIRIFKNGFKVFHQDSISPMLNKRELDEYIRKHLSEMDEKKLLISGPSNAAYTSFKDLKDILKKYELYRFRIVTDGEAAPAGGELHLPEPK